MLMPRSTWIAAIGACVPLLSACADPIVRVNVGETQFCVPRAEHEDADYWWIPRDLPKGDGFRFSIRDFFSKRPELYPARDIAGRTIALSGRVTSASEFRSWRNPRPGHYFHSVAQIPVKEAVPFGGPYVGVYESPSKDAWHVWKVPDTDLALAGEMKLSDVGSMVGICRITGASLNVRYRPTSCSHFIIHDDVVILTRFAFQNLLRLEQFDAAVKHHVSSWKCG